MKYIYPAVFSWSEADKAYIVQFADADNWFTDGATIAEAMENAIDVLNLMLLEAEESGDEIPQASKLETVKVDDDNSFAQYIFADTAAYKQMIEFRKMERSA